MLRAIPACLIPPSSDAKITPLVMLDKSNRKAIACLVLLSAIGVATIFLIASILHTFSNAFVMKIQSPPPDKLAKVLHVVCLTSSKFFLENPTRSDVQLGALQNEIKRTTILLGIEEIDLSGVPSTIASPRTTTTSSFSSSSLPPKSDSAFGVSLSSSASSTTRNAPVRFVAQVVNSLPSPEFHFAIVNTLSPEPAVDEVPSFDHIPILSNEFEACFDKVGEARVVVRAYNSSGQTARAIATIQITNAPPEIVVEGVPPAVYRGEKIIPILEVLDPEEDSVSVTAEIPSSAKIEDGPTVSFSMQDLGDHKIVFTAKDQHGASTSAKIYVKAINRPPFIKIPEKRVVALPLEDVFIAVEAGDLDGDKVDVKVASKMGVIRETNGGYIISHKNLGEHQVEVIAIDEEGGLTKSTITVEVKNPNNHPTRQTNPPLSKSLATP